jgi:hypothetical protein
VSASAEGPAGRWAVADLVAIDRAVARVRGPSA